MAPDDDIPWLSLTALDRLFARSTGAGVLFLLTGTVFGALSFVNASIESPWYRDAKTLLTFGGCAFYVFVWYLRKKRGFCSRLVVGLGTLGFALLLLAFFAPGLFGGFHAS